MFYIIIFFSMNALYRMTLVTFHPICNMPVCLRSVATTGGMSCQQNIIVSDNILDSSQVVTVTHHSYNQSNDENRWGSNGSNSTDIHTASIGSSRLSRVFGGWWVIATSCRIRCSGDVCRSDLFACLPIGLQSISLRTFTYILCLINGNSTEK